MKRTWLFVRLSMATLLVAGASAALLVGCGSSNALGNTPDIRVTASQTAATTSSKVNANAEVSTVPSAQTVSLGGSFDVMVNVKTDVPSRGFEVVLNWDPAKVQCNSVEEGDFYKTFVNANKINRFLSPDPLDFDNDVGKFPAGADTIGVSGMKTTHMAAVALLGGAKLSDGSFIGPTGAGSVFVLHMTAKNSASGAVAFTLSSVKLNNNTSPPMDLNAKLNNGQITIK